MNRAAFIVTLFVTLSPCLAKYSGGSGTPEDPYRISDHNDLYALADDANDYNKCFIQTSDIDLDPNLPGRRTLTKALIAPDINNTKSGFQGNYFTGTFDGNDCNILNLRINGQDYLGMFGYIYSGSSVRNLGLEDANAAGTGNYVGGLVGYAKGGSVTDSYATGMVSGGNYVGGLVGWVSGNVSNSYATGTVSGGNYVGGLVGWASGNVSNCYATGEVTGTGSSYYVGGLVGYGSRGSVTNCYATGEVAGNYHVGGLAGYAYYANVTDCYAAGTVTGNGNVGGLVGYVEYSSVTNCYATGAVTGNSTVGGLVGYVYSGGVTNCYATGTVIGVDYVGGLVGYRYSCTVTNSFWDVNTSGTFNGVGNVNPDPAGAIGKTTSQMQQAFYFQLYNWGGTTWTIDEGNDYPHLAWENAPGEFITDPEVTMAGSGTLEDPWLIESEDDFLVVCAGSFFWDKHYVLNTDIDLSGVTYTCALIGYDNGEPFTGSFDGGGHIISNLTIKGADYLGLFGYIGSGSSVSHLGLADVNITGTGYYFGGLTGYTYYANVTNCYATGTVSGDGNYVGGLAGYADLGVVTNCHATAAVSGNSDVGGLLGWNFHAGLTNCYATGEVTGNDGVGGLVGCAYAGSVTVTNCYATGEVTGNGDYVGGLVGIVNFGSVTNCYATGKVSSTGGYVGGLLGESYYVNVADCSVTGVVHGNNNYVGGLMGYVYHGSVTNCYATGAVTGNGSYAGGLAGYISSCTLASSFWDVNTSGTGDGVGNVNPDPNGVMGRTTVQLMTLSTFTDAGWDFVDETVNGTNDVWAICEGTNYPRLVWSIPAADMVCPDGVTFVDYAYLTDHWFWTDYGDVNGIELTGNGRVDNPDFAVFANWWGQAGCGDCGGADYSHDGNVDSADLEIFCDNWLVTEYGDVEGAELTGDGVVDLADLLFFSEQWLTGF